MSKIVLLDSGPVGMLVNPYSKPLSIKIKAWLEDLKAHNIVFVVPEIIDYEMRRELLYSKIQGVKKVR